MRSPSMTGEEKPPTNPGTDHLMASLPSLPLRVASKARIMPISLLSRFSSPWEAMAYLPFTTMPVLRPRLAITRLKPGSPVCGFMASAAPSAPPVNSRRVPSTVTIFRAITGIVRTPARCADPYDVACALIERDEALRAVGLRAPSGCGRRDDHQVAVDRRRNGAAAVCSEGRELFGDGALPQLLAVFGERGEQVVDAEAVDVAGFGVGDRQGPAHAMRRHVALIQRELILPQQLAGVGVEAHEALLLGLARAGGVFEV